jgi:hypothetical protein
MYVVVADSLQIPLLTADRKLYGLIVDGATGVLWTEDDLRFMTAPP